jgi:hypothetical protein
MPVPSALPTHPATMDRRLGLTPAAGAGPLADAIAFS